MQVEQEEAEMDVTEEVRIAALPKRQKLNTVGVGRVMPNSCTRVARILATLF